MKYTLRVLINLFQRNIGTCIPTCETLMNKLILFLSIYRVDFFLRNKKVNVTL